MDNLHSESEPDRRVPRQARARARYDLILDTTREILRKEGIGGVTTNRIAEIADIPVSSIYQYFPNKVSILCAVFETYLEEVREVFEKFDDPEYLTLPWQEFMHLFLEEVLNRERRGKIDKELNTGLGLYAELREIDERHANIANEYISGYLRGLGSRWSRTRLRRIAAYLYEVNTASWEYRSKYNPPGKEVRDWEMAAILGIVSQCFE